MKIDIDLRKKGCPNPNCPLNKNKKKQSLKIEYCPKCGTKLVYVCAKCFREIKDEGPNHRICLRCEAEAEEKRDQMIDRAKGVGMKAVQGVGVIAAGAAVKVVKERGTKIADAAIKNGGKILGGVVKAVIHK